MTAWARRSTRRHLRILAFHGVPDLMQFQRVLDEVLRYYTPVSETDVAQALAGERPLAPNPVWFTFDDGLPSTFAAGALLQDRGVSATSFVCPSVIDTEDLLWFQVWDRCSELGLIETAEQERFSLGRLKRLPDRERREETDVLNDRLSTGADKAPVQADQAMLEGWVAQGHSIGNHTWDHPLLDQCEPDEQRDQVERAHVDLVNRGFTPKFLAYPNGNWAPDAEAAAIDLGYVGSLMFDHRLTERSQPRHRLSRLRIDSDVSERRAASILSGAHPTAVHLVPGM